MGLLANALKSAPITEQLTPQQVAIQKPKIQNPDETVSTEKSITIEADGKFINIPTIWNGKELSKDEAVKMAKSSGINFEKFDTLDSAVAAAQKRSRDIGQALQQNNGFKIIEDFVGIIPSELKAIKKANYLTVSTEKSISPLKNALALVKKTTVDLKTPEGIEELIKKAGAEPVKKEESGIFSTVLDFLENLRRGEYAATAAAKEMFTQAGDLVPQIVAKAEEGLKTGEAVKPVAEISPQKILGKAVKGFKKEEKISGQEVLETFGVPHEFFVWTKENQDKLVNKIIRPTIKIADREIKIPLFGPASIAAGFANDLNINLGSTAGFTVETVLDPLTYVPFGLPIKTATKLVSRLGRLFVKGAKIGLKSTSPAALKIIEEMVESAGRKTKKYIELFNPKLAARKAGGSEITQTFAERLYSSSEKAKRDVEMAFGLPINKLKKQELSDLHGTLMKSRDESNKVFTMLIDEEMMARNSAIKELQKVGRDRIKAKYESKLSIADQRIEEIKQALKVKPEVPPTLYKLFKQAKNYDNFQDFTSSLRIHVGKKGKPFIVYGDKNNVLAALSKKSDLEDIFNKAQLTKNVRVPLKSLIKERDKLRGIVKSQVIKEQNILDEQIKFIREQAIEPLAYKKGVSEFDKIFEESIANLNPQMKMAARNIRTLMDDIGEKEFKLGALERRTPNYFPRAIDDPAMLPGYRFVETLFAKKNLSVIGLGGFKKAAKFDSFDEFSKFAKKYGTKAKTDPVETLFDRLRRSYEEEAKVLLKNELNAKYLDRIPREVVNYLEYIYNPKSHPIARLGALGTWYNKGLNFTKGLLTSINPAFYGRNLLGYPFIGATSAGIRAFNPKDFTEALIIKTDGKSKLFSKAGESVTAKDFLNSMVDHNLIGSSFTRGDIKTSVNTLFRRYSKLNPMRWYSEAFHYAQEVEDFGRLANAIHHWKDGKSIKEAARIAKETLFNYTDLTPVDKALQGLFGFYTFKRKNFPKQFMNVLNDPKQYTVLSRAIQTISGGQTLAPDERMLLSNFDKQSLHVVGELSNGIRKLTRLGFVPIEEAFQTAKIIEKFLKGQVGKGLEEVGAYISPFILKPALERVSGRHLFYDKPLDQIRRLPRQYNILSDQALSAINKAAEVLGYQPFERKQIPVYKNGKPTEETKEVLEGDWRFVHLITSLPSNRFISDSLKLADEKDAIRYFTGITKTELDIESAKYFKELERKNQLLEQAKNLGLVRTFEIPFVPRETKEKMGLPVKKQKGQYPFKKKIDQSIGK